MFIARGHALRVAVGLLAAGCAEPAIDEPDETGDVTDGAEGGDDLAQPEQRFLLEEGGGTGDGCERPTHLAYQLCDAPPEGLTLASSARGHFQFHYVTGSAAESNIDHIATVREEAYASIRAALAIAHEPTIEVHLSPTRVIAAALGRRAGMAFPGSDRYEVIYTGDPLSYEGAHYGHELTHVLAYYLEPGGVRSLAILEEGLAEYLDQSERDLHHAYIDKLLAGIEDLEHWDNIEDGDVWGWNYGRAGSLVTYLVEEYGMDSFLDIYRKAKIGWSNGCWRHEPTGCLGGAASVIAAIGWSVEQVTGDTWTDVQHGWSAVVSSYIEQGPTEMSAHDWAEIQRVIQAMDQAVNCDDWAVYRSAVDGFYCDWRSEAGRVTLSERMVDKHDQFESTVLALYPIGTRNYPEAVALVQRTDSTGGTVEIRLRLEKFQEGWRTTWDDGWK